MFKSIRGRLILSYIFLALCSVATMSILGIGLVQRYAAQQEREFLHANAQAIARQANLLMHLPGPDVGLYRLTQSAAFLGDMEVQIYDPADRLLAASSPDATSTEFTWIANTDLPTLSNSLSPTVAVGLADSFSSATQTNTITGTVTREEIAGARLETRPEIASSRRHLTGAPVLIVGIPPQGDTETGAAETANDSTLNLAESQMFTVRRSPSFWGHRLSFGPAHHEDPSTPHHMHRMEQAPTTPGSTSDQVRIVPTTGNAEHLPSRLAVLREHIYPMRASLAIAPIGEVITQERDAISAATSGEYGYVAVSRPADFQAEPLAALRQVLLIAAAGAIGLATVIGLGVSRGLTSPIQSLAQAAKRMQAGDLSTRAPVHNQDELGELASQFNRMAQQLQSSFDELQQERDTLRRFVADASHELRTPMTALRTFTELLQGNAGADAAARAEFLRESTAQLTRLEWITRNLLDLSRLDAGVATLDMAREDLAALLQAAAAPFYAQAQTAGIELRVHLPTPPVSITCDGARVEMALRNLLDNALKFTPTGGKVEIGATPIDNVRAQEADSGILEKENNAHIGDIPGKAVRIWVQDTGTGIDPADRPHIFERFYRSPQARQEGSGLGLAIVRSIAHAHGGAVAVESDRAAGSRFELILPSQPPAQDVPPA